MVNKKQVPLEIVWFIAILSAVLTWCCFLFLYKSLQQTYCTTTSETNNYIKHLSTLVTCLYVLTMFIVFIFNINVVFDPAFRHKWAIWCIFIFALYYIGRCAMLLLFIFRIYFTFHGSIFALNKCTLYLLYTLSLIMLLFAISLVIVGWSGILTYSNQSEYQYILRIRGMTIQSFVTIEFILEIILIVLFTKKLFALYIQMKISKISHNISRTVQPKLSACPSSTGGNNVSSVGSIDVISGQHSEHTSIERKRNVDVNADLLSAMTRYTLLVTISIVSSLLSMIISSVANYVYYQFIVTGIDSFINALCIYLFNGFAIKTYQLLCKYPHILCGKCCIQCIRCFKK